jgi:hypothetical protein
VIAIAQKWVICFKQTRSAIMPHPARLAKSQVTGPVPSSESVQASQVQALGNITNTMSGGTQHGPVLQGRDFTGLTFGAPLAPAASGPDE